MRMLLTAEEVSEALQNYVNDQVTLKDGQEVSVEIAADGSASVDFRNTGKPAARKSTPRKNKTKAAEKAEPEVDNTPEPEPQAEAQPETQSEQEAEAEDKTPEPAPNKSVFSMGDKMKAPKEDAPEESKTEEAPAAESRPAGTSIFSRVS